MLYAGYPMIYTVTFNPAIDCVMRVRDVRFGSVNRCEAEEIYYGGKGINVSTVLGRLGCENTAWGFVAGFMGLALEAALKDVGMTCDFIHLSEGETRINAKLKGCDDDAPTAATDTASITASDVETAINAKGPVVDAAALDALFIQLQTIGEDDILVVSGGAPRGVDDDVYARILQGQQNRGSKIVVDATGDLLLNALPYGPWLIKPNDEEIAQMVGCDPLDGAELIDGARELQRRGARNVLVSRGGEGSILLDERKTVHRAPALSGELSNSVGAGDSMVAGFVAGYVQSLQADGDEPRAFEHAFALAQACGSATAFSPGLAPLQTIRELLARIEG